MTETDIQHTEAPAAAVEADAEPATPASEPIVNEPPKDEDRFEHAKNSLIGAIESAVGKFTDTLGITGGRK
ncbi:MAG: hypothetical protein ABR947_00145 [Solirubrobacteraceae bacterium]|jgi:hypothetical protein